MQGVLTTRPMTADDASAGPVVPVRDGRAGALLLVTNRTSRAIWSFSVLGHRSGSWGDDILEGAIRPGDTVAWEIVPGLYHLRAETADGTEAYQFGVRVRHGHVVRWEVRD